MPRALCPLHNPQVAGLPTNLRFLQDLAAHPAFLDMDLDTGAPLVLCVCVIPLRQYVNVCQCVSMYVNVCQCVSMYVNVCQCVSMRVNVCQCVSMHQCVNQYVSILLYVSMCMSAPGSHRLLLPAVCVVHCMRTGFIERHRGTLLKVTPPPLHIVGIAAALWVKLLAVRRGSKQGGSSNKGRQYSSGIAAADICVLLCLYCVHDPPAVCVTHHPPTTILQDAAAAAAGPVALRGSAMGAWAASDAKRLWHDLVRPLTLRDAESDADMRVQLMQRSGTDYEVCVVCGCMFMTHYYLQ
jgi:hypothetical protein